MPYYPENSYNIVIIKEIEKDFKKKTLWIDLSYDTFDYVKASSIMESACQSRDSIAAINILYEPVDEILADQDENKPLAVYQFLSKVVKFSASMRIPLVVTMLSDDGMDNHKQFVAYIITINNSDIPKSFHTRIFHWQSQLDIWNNEERRRCLRARSANEIINCLVKQEKNDPGWSEDVNVWTSYPLKEYKERNEKWLYGDYDANTYEMKQPGIVHALHDNDRPSLVGIFRAFRARLPFFSCTDRTLPRPSLFNIVRAFGTGKDIILANVFRRTHKAIVGLDALQINPDSRLGISDHQDLFDLLSKSDEDVLRNTILRTANYFFHKPELPSCEINTCLEKVKEQTTTFCKTDINEEEYRYINDVIRLTPDQKITQINESSPENPVALPDLCPDALIADIVALLNEVANCVNAVPVPAAGGTSIFRRLYIRTTEEFRLRRELNQSLRNVERGATATGTQRGMDYFYREYIRGLLENPIYFDLTPNTFKESYEKFYNQVLRPTILLYATIFRQRRILFFRIPLYLPTLIYFFKAPMRWMRRILRTEIMILDFYWRSFFAVSRYQAYRRDTEKIIDSIIYNHKVCQEHTNNIIKELEIMAVHRNTTVQYIKNFSKDMKGISAENYNQKDDDEIGPITQEEADKLYSEIKQQRLQSENKVTSAFNPKSYHHKEAYVTAGNMIKEIENMVNVLQSEEIQYYCNIDWVEYESICEMHCLLELKRHILCNNCMADKTSDLLTPSFHMNENKDVIDFIESYGQKTGFITINDNIISISIDSYRFLSEKSRIFFFQRKIGLTAKECAKICKKDNYIRSALIVWYNDFLYDNSDYRDISEATIEEIYAEIVMRSSDDQLDYVHQYFGSLNIDDNLTYIMLKDTYDENMMRLYQVRDDDYREKNIEQRHLYLPMMRDFLNKDANLQDILSALFDYMIINHYPDIIEVFRKYLKK